MASLLLNIIFFTLLTFMSIYRAGVDVDLVGALPGAGEAGDGLEAGEAGAGLDEGEVYGVGLEAGAASVVGVLVVDWGEGCLLVLGGSGVLVMGRILPVKGRMISGITLFEEDSFELHEAWCFAALALSRSRLA